MSQQVFTVQLIAAAAAAVTTLAIFGTVVGLAEPRRGALLAKAERAEQMAQPQRSQLQRHARAELSVATNAAARTGH